MKALIGFAGFGGPDIALREAGIETTGIENDYAIAEVNRVNGGNVIVADILSIDPADFIGWLLYHFSPPCPSYSVANHNSSESDLDISLAQKICEFIRVGRPKFFTLENVWLYRKSLSWLLIWYTLLEEGYGVDAWNLNAADYGVPQSRRRMIVIGRRDGRRPAKPWPTYSKNPDMFTRPWVGWYEAIEDLLPSLPETNFADWQIDRMPEKLQETMLIGHSSQELGLARTDKPAFTVTTNSNRSRAFIINSQNASAGRALTVREDKSPMFTVTANIEEKNSPPKAFVVDCQYKNFNGERDLIIRTEDQPIFTMTASANRSTIRASLGQGRVVSMTPRCLARFQDFPDRFILPGDPGLDENIVLLLDSRSDRELACQGIGNALPPGLYRSVLRSLDLEA